MHETQIYKSHNYLHQYHTTTARKVRYFNFYLTGTVGSEAWEEYSSGLLSLIKDFVLSVWEERKVRLYGEHANVHQSHSQIDSGDLRVVAGGDGELGCLCCKADTSHLCDGSAPPIHLGAWSMPFELL